MQSVNLAGVKQTTLSMIWLCEASFYYCGHDIVCRENVIVFKLQILILLPADSNDELDSHGQVWILQFICLIGFYVQLCIQC